MARETAEFLNRAISRGASGDWDWAGLVGEALLESGFPHTGASLLATAAREGIPATVHVAIGTDIIHLHPSMDPEATGRATYRDFQTFCSVVKTLEGGVFINIGSAVILPEVFLKAVTLVRNLGWPLEQITTVNFDFIRHYRPATNVVRRPTLEGGARILSDRPSRADDPAPGRRGAGRLGGGRQGEILKRPAIMVIVTR